MTMRKLETVFTLLVVLMAVYKDVIDASDAARGTDFSVKKKVLVRKFRSNILKSVYNVLSDFLVTSSAEALELARSKSRSRSSSPKKKAKVSKVAVEQEFQNILADETSILHSSPSSFNAPGTPIGKKRVFSNESKESYGLSSTETTPT